MQTYHTSVLLDEVIQFLEVKPGEVYLDGTLGGGGHTLAILNAGGHVLSIDQDDEAIAYASERIHSEYPEGKSTIVKGNFRDLDTIAHEQGIDHVSGVLLDLGVSSHQLDTPERGFSFQKSGPLDMRMDRSLSVSARDLVNGLTKHELSELLYKLGEEYRSRTIAQAIVSEREKGPIETTEELERVVRHAVGSRFTPKDKQTSIHPATKVFQALRIAINDEVHSLEEALPKAVRLLKPGGKLVVISFHSLEDRIVKQAFKAFEREGLGTIVTEKPLTPSEEELQRNSRARSSKLRVFTRTV